LLLGCRVIGEGPSGVRRWQASDVIATICLPSRWLRNHHLFQPLLYWVATAGLSPADICSPIRQILRKQKNTEVILAAYATWGPECVKRFNGLSAL